MENRPKETTEPPEEAFVEHRTFKRRKKDKRINRTLGNLINSAQLGLRITKTFLVDVCSSDTISSIKDKIKLFEADSCEQQKLFFGGNHLEDTKTLADYNISTGSIVDVDVEVIMEICIKIPSLDKTLKLDVNCVDTVHDLKVMIHNEVEISPNHQLLVFCGETLHDNQVLVACGVRKNSKLYVMFNPLAEVHLYIQTSSGDFFDVEAMGGYTIRDVKVIVESLKGIPASRQKFVRDKEDLLDSFSLSFCKLLYNSVIHLHVQMQIFVKIETGKTITIEAEDSNTVTSIIAKIKSKANLSMLNFMLLYSGKVLLEQETLAFYGIHNESEIFLLAKKPCGNRAPCENYIFLTIEMHGSTPPAPLSVRRQSTIAELKRLIAIFLGRIFIRMKLRCKENGVELEDEKLTLADYDVKDNAVLHLSSN